MSERIRPVPPEERVAPNQGETEQLEGYFMITPETLGRDGETFYLGQEARITIERDKKSPTGLSVYSPFSEEKRNYLHWGINKVGRSPECDVVINIPTVSRFHADIKVERDAVYVFDNESTNHTFIEK